MKTKKYVLLLVLLTTFSCSKQNHFSQFIEFPDENRWDVADKKTFEFEIDDDTKNYNVSLLFSHVYGYQFNSIPIVFEIENPDGTTEEIKEDLLIKDDEGKDLGDCVGDICDLNYTFKSKTKLQKGTYKITVSHSFNGLFLPNVIGIGLKVDAVK
jgi:gliding motility-associated lipoprotein GldH